MPRRRIPKIKIPPPSRLSKLLQSFRQKPKPLLQGVTALKLIYAAKNDHWGARHFAKEHLPQIQYVNPALKIEVSKVSSPPLEPLKPEMTVQFQDGTTKVVDMAQKWSTSIYEQLLDAAGGKQWERWKAERTAAGLSLFDGKLKKPEHYQPQHRPQQAPKTGAAAVLP